MALTGTATRATKSGIIESLGLSHPVIIESNPDRPNIYYASHIHPHRGDEKLKSILDPIVSELQALKIQKPLSLIYGSLETVSECFLYLSQNMGKDHYYPANADPLAKNRLFTQYHAQYPVHERARIIEELVKGTSTHRVLFVTSGELYTLVSHTQWKTTIKKWEEQAEMVFQPGPTFTTIHMTYQNQEKT